MKTSKQTDALQFYTMFIVIAFEWRVSEFESYFECFLWELSTPATELLHMCRKITNRPPPPPII